MSAAPPHIKKQIRSQTLRIQTQVHADFAPLKAKLQPNSVVAILKGGAREQSKLSSISLWLIDGSAACGLCPDVVRMAIQNLWRPQNETKPEPSISGTGLERSRDRMSER